MTAPLRRAAEPIVVPVALGDARLRHRHRPRPARVARRAHRGAAAGARAAIVTDETVAKHHLAAAEAALDGAGIDELGDRRAAGRGLEELRGVRDASARR